MPWKETCIVDQRLDFIAAVRQDPRGNFTLLCERFGISRQTGYARLARYKQLGAKGLEDDPPRARSCPHKTPVDVEDRIVSVASLFEGTVTRNVAGRTASMCPAADDARSERQIVAG